MLELPYKPAVERSNGRLKVERGYERKGPTVPPTAEALLQKVLELSLDIGQACDRCGTAMISVGCPGSLHATGVITRLAGEGGRNRDGWRPNLSTLPE
jgi:hypothetical protein